MNRLMLLFLLLPGVSSAAVTLDKVDVFTVDGLLYEMESARLSKQLNVPVNVRQIDTIYKLEMNLSAGLPGNEADAAPIAADRISKLSKQMVLRTYSTAAESLTLARTIGVDKVPAVVFNEKWIVYGVDPLQAYTIFEGMNNRGELAGMSRGQK
ncbi:DUF1525 domain-containing protein [Aeromonas sp. Y311-2]|uniref:DUF1525 domain-containing protein n=1 Tax=Aeromonas sp. Y311-2 TaxID=2990507 RepID=UPI0022E83CBF|nr:DUF1525 domain-containing protein [Aeromonas sp. Y311-2]